MTNDSTEVIGSPLATYSSASYTHDVVGKRTDMAATYFVGNRLAQFNGGWFIYGADGNVHQKYLIPPTGRKQMVSWNVDMT